MTGSSVGARLWVKGKMMNVRVLAALCCVTAGCAAGPIGPIRGPAGELSSRVEVVDASALPPPTRSDLVGPSRDYLVGPFDTLTIDVYGIEELSRRDVRADAAGRIAFPLVGTIDAAGLTPAQLGERIEQRLRERHIRDPQVTVNLREAVSRVITVDGQVKQPGLYPVIGQMTLMRAVATAQGLSEYAQQDDVVVFRTVNGQRLAALYNLRAIRRGAYDDPELFANDVVIVGDSPARRIFRDALQVLPLLTTPLIIALQSGSTP